MNTDAPWPSLDEARARVLGIQTKLHRWAADDSDRRFDDLFNLACDRVRGNRGARTAGVDGVKPRDIGTKDGEEFLRELREDLKARRFVPLPVRERMIPKTSGKLRRLGIPTARDRCVQASLKLVLEPIFEADFKPCSYGFRPMRRAQDAIEEIHHFGRLSYERILEGDIASCFDEISHSALLDRVRGRIADRRVLSLVKAFLIAGILSEDGAVRGSKTGTPQGGILSPCLANIALSALDEHFAETWRTTMATNEDRVRRRRRGLPMYRLVRYADDFVVMVSGTEAQAEALKVEIAAVLATIGLRLSEEKTSVCHINEGFDFLGFRIQRKRKRGSNKVFVYSWPSKKALASIMAKIKAITKQGTDQPLADVLRQVNAALHGWAVYFRHGCSKQTFNYLARYAWPRVVGWIRRKHRRATWKAIRRRYLTLPGNRLVPHDGGIVLFNVAGARPVRGAGRGNGSAERSTPRPGSTPPTGFCACRARRLSMSASAPRG